jgi:hypothetical protein
MAYRHTKRSNTRSFSCSGSSILTQYFGGRRFFNSRSVINNRHSAMKPRALTAQPKPIRSISLFSNIGMTKPPVPNPHRTTPIARLRFDASKYIEMTDIIGTNMQPFPSPQNPYARTNCPNSVQMFVTKMPNSHSPIPIRSTNLKWPVSEAAPDNNGVESRKKP